MTRSTQCHRIKLQLLVMACFAWYGYASFDALQDAVDSVKEQSTKAANTVSDGYDNAKSWAADTWNDAAKAGQDATDRVRRDAAELSRVLEDSSKDATEKAKALWESGFPTCRDVMYAVRDELNSTFASKIETAFLLQKCTADVRSDACFNALSDLWVDAIFEAMWSPVKVGLSSASLPARTAADVVKDHAKDAIRGPLSKAAQPLAKGTQDIMIGADLDTSTADDVLLRAKQETIGLKDELLRAMESNSADLCRAIGAEPGEGEVSEACNQRRLCLVLALAAMWLK